jgi:hypothetical protein
MLGMFEALGASPLSQAASVDDAATRTSKMIFFMTITSS